MSRISTRYLAVLSAPPYREVCIGHAFNHRLLGDVKSSGIFLKIYGNIMYQRYLCYDLFL